MRKIAIFMTWLMILVDCLGCTTTKMLSEAAVRNVVPKEPAPEVAKNEPIQEVTKEKTRHERMDLAIPLTLLTGSFEINAEIFRPEKMIKPKTLVIMVPGSGNVSRRGETNTDGITTFKTPIDINYKWAEALADQGLFVLAYDKRTCNSKINPLCRDLWHKDIDEEGITALASDLDQVCNFAGSQMDEGGRVILMGSTQAAQIISLSNCLKKANALVLLSPIVGELDKLWINGLQNASLHAKSDRNQLANRKESMEAFFISLKKGDFPAGANIKGASLKFWQSFMAQSPKTLPKILESKKPSLMLFSAKDFFSANPLMQKIKSDAKNHGQFKLSLIEDSGRNLADEQGVSKEALRQITTFIKGLR